MSRSPWPTAPSQSSATYPRKIPLMTVTATSQLSPPDYPTEPGHSPEPDTTPLPRKETHRLRKALVATTAVVAVGAISFLAVSLSSATNSEAHYKGQLQAANGVIRADNATIKAN